MEPAKNPGRFIPFGSTLIAGIGKHHRLLSVQQTMPLGHVVDVGRCADDGMHQTRIDIHPNVGFHAEVPLLALLGLVHLGVTFAAAVFGRTGRSNQGGIDHRSGLEHQPPGRQCGVDGGQQWDAQAVVLKQMAKPQDGGLIGQAHGAWVKARKLAVKRDVMQGLFHGGVRQAKPLLQKVNAQHGLNRKRRAPTFGCCCLGRKWFNQTHQLRPRNHQVHLVEEHAFASPLGDQFKSGGGKADLFHRDITLLKAQRLARFCRDSLVLLCHKSSFAFAFPQHGHCPRRAISR